MDTLLIESSRQSAVTNATPGGTPNINKFTQNLTKTIATDSWKTNIPSGIPLVPGDQISLESASINILGAGESDFLTFRGKSNVKTDDNLEITDNKAQAEISYYVTNNCQFNFNLPSGTHMITDSDGGRGFNNENFGTVDLTGKHIWGINFAQGIPFPQNGLLAKKFKWNQQQFGMDRNCAFFQGQNNDILLPGFTPGPPDGNGIKQLGELCGYASWIQSVPYHGLPGTYFNQNQNVNMNIENKDTCPFVQDQSSSPSVLWDLQVPNSASAEVPFIQGGASPYQVLNQGPSSQNVVIYAADADRYVQFGNYRYSNRTDGSVALPKSVNDYITRNDGIKKYNDLLNFEAARFKGGYTNYKPNSIRLYCSEINTKSLVNLGPLYNIDVNPIVVIPGPDEPNFKNVPRDTQYFNKMTKIIDFELPTGNISSSRVGEVLTNQLKLLNDSSNFLDNSIFLTTKDSDVTIIKKELESLKSKTMMEYPTMTGLCLNSKWKYEGQVTPDNWSVTELEQDASKCGEGYKTAEALNKFYQNMLVGNPAEWRLITEVLPQLQFGPMDLSTLQPASELGYILSYYTMVTGGFDKLFPAPAALPAPGNTPRKMPSGNTDNTKYSVGEFGCFPCIIHATAPSDSLSDLNIHAFSSMYAITQNSRISSPPASVAPAGSYDIHSLSGRVSMVYVPRKGIQSGFKTLKVSGLDLIVTNIIFDGQVPNKLLNENAERIQKHNESPATNNLIDNDYLNNTYVDWVIGRIDDQRTYPENHAILSSSLTGDLPQSPYLTGVVGTPVYVPNIFQTYKLFNGNPGKYINDTPASNQSVGDINPILVNGTGTPQIGSYAMINQPNGLELNTNSGGTTEYPAVAWKNQLPPTPYPVNGEFGLPCLSTYSNSYNEKNDGFKSNVLRTIKGYRYLPQGKGVEYNAINAYNEQIPMGSAGNVFSTRPVRLTFTQLETLWDSIKNLNDSKGVGWIPVFYKFNTNPSTNPTMLDVPLLAMIVNEASNEHPYPETGEYFFMGSPSLSQNILAFPTSTQQTSFQTNPTKSSPDILQGSSSTRTDPTVQYNQPYVGVNNWTGYARVDTLSGEIFMPDAQTPVLPPNEISDIPTFSTVVLPTDEFVQNGTFGNSGYSLSTTINAGASDPLIDFNQNFNRFAISNFHTPSFKGNGVFQLGNFGPSSNPETIQKILNSQISAFSQQVDLPVFYFTKLYDPTAWDPDDSSSAWKVYKTDAPYLTGTQRDLYSPGKIGYEGSGTPPPVIADPCAGFQPLQAQSIDGNCIYCTLGPRSIDSTGQNMGSLIDNNSEPGGLMRKIDDFIPETSNDQSEIDGKIELDKPQFTLKSGAVPPAVGRTVFFVTTTNVFYQGVVDNVIPSSGKHVVIISVLPQIAFDASTVGFKLTIQYYKNEVSTNYLGNPQYMSPFNGTQGNIRGGALDQNDVFYNPFPTTGSTTGPTTEQQSLQSGNVISSANLLFPTLRPFAYIKQDDLKSEKSYATSSQSGISLEKIYLITKSGTSIEVDSYDKELFNGSLFNKLGYDVDQLIPFAGKPSTMYNNELYNSNTKLTSRIFDSRKFCVKPFTTNAFMDTSSIPSLVSMFGTADVTSSKNVVNTNMPAFNLGSIRASAATTAQSDILPARNLVQKFNVPNFLLKSNIISACSQQFIGGINGRTMLPVVAPLNTNYAVGDYIYVSRSDLVFQVTKDTVLTDITSEITYPDGTTTEDILAEDSSVIYRIDFNVEERNRRIFEEEQEKVKKEKITKNK